MTKYKVVKLSRMLIAGVDALTSNEKEFAGAGKIPALWHRFLTEDVFSKIPNRKDESTIVGACTDIESDETGLYRFVLGTEATSFDGVPPGFVRRVVPAALYTEWTTERGAFDEVSLACWQKIWADKALKSCRSFLADLELYERHDMDPETLQFRFYVGVEDAPNSD